MKDIDLQNIRKKCKKTELQEKQRQKKIERERLKRQEKPVVLK